MTAIYVCMYMFHLHYYVTLFYLIFFAVLQKGTVFLCRDVCIYRKSASVYSIYLMY